MISAIAVSNIAIIKLSILIENYEKTTSIGISGSIAVQKLR